MGNALAYYSTAVEIFLNIYSGGRVFVPYKPVQLRLVFAGKVRAYLIDEILICSSLVLLGRLLALPTNIRLSCKGLAMYKYSSLFVPFVNFDP